MKHLLTPQCYFTMLLAAGMFGIASRVNAMEVVTQGLDDVTKSIQTLVNAVGGKGGTEETEKPWPINDEALISSLPDDASTQAKSINNLNNKMRDNINEALENLEQVSISKQSIPFDQALTQLKYVESKAEKDILIRQLLVINVSVHLEIIILMLHTLELKSLSKINDIFKEINTDFSSVINTIPSNPQTNALHKVLMDATEFIEQTLYLSMGEIISAESTSYKDLEPARKAVAKIKRKLPASIKNYQYIQESVNKLEEEVAQFAPSGGGKAPITSDSGINEYIQKSLGIIKSITQTPQEAIDSISQQNKYFEDIIAAFKRMRESVSKDTLGKTLLNTLIKMESVLLLNLSSIKDENEYKTLSTAISNQFQKIESYIDQIISQISAKNKDYFSSAALKQLKLISDNSPNLLRLASFFVNKSWSAKEKEFSSLLSQLMKNSELQALPEIAELLQKMKDRAKEEAEEAGRRAALPFKGQGYVGKPPTGIQEALTEASNLITRVISRKSDLYDSSLDKVILVDKDINNLSNYFSALDSKLNYLSLTLDSEYNSLEAQNPSDTAIARYNKNGIQFLNTLLSLLKELVLLSAFTINEKQYEEIKQQFEKALDYSKLSLFPGQLSDKDKEVVDALEEFEKRKDLILSTAEVVSTLNSRKAEDQGGIRGYIIDLSQILKESSLAQDPLIKEAFERMQKRLVDFKAASPHQQGATVG